MPFLRDALPKMLVETLMKYDISVSDADVEVTRLKSGGWSFKVKSAKISFLVKPKQH